MENEKPEVKSKKEKLKKIHQSVKHVARKAAGKITKKVILIAVCVLVVWICFFGAFGVGAYKLGWDNKLANAAVRILPFPAAIMSNGHLVTFSNWKFEVLALRQLNTKQAGSYDEVTVENDVLDKLINEKIVSDLAHQFKVKMTKEDLSQKMTELETQIGGKEELATKVKEYFGWDIKTFENRVLRADTLRALLEKKLSTDDKALAEAETKIKSIKADIESGKITFEDAAKQYSIDTSSGENGGELGFFPRGVMVKEFEDAVFSLEKGKVSEPVKTQYGYHLILLVDKKAADGDAAEQVSAKHILIAPKGLAEYIKEYKEKVKTYKFVGTSEK